MRVWVQPDQLSARGLTVQDVENAIVSRNVEIPAGRIESTRREYSVRARSSPRASPSITWRRV